MRQDILCALNTEEEISLLVRSTLANLLFTGSSAGVLIPTRIKDETCRRLLMAGLTLEVAVENDFGVSVFTTKQA